jgi:hypothetical protein
MKWWTRFTVARPILLPTHQPTAHGAHTESLGATHPVARTPSSWDATGNYFQPSLPSRSRSWIGYGVSYFGCYPGSTFSEHSIKYELTSLRLLQQILKPNVKERCSSRMPWHPSKFNDSIIHHYPNEVK